MGMRYDHRGNRSRTWRHISDNTDIPLLVGDGWQDLAYTELLCLQLTTSALHQQLAEKSNCHEEVGKASDALKSALRVFQQECDKDEPRSLQCD